jgi:hypothetical protein
MSVPIHNVIMNEVVNGIHITEKNRATVWEWSADGLQILQKIAREFYLDKGVRAVICGIYNPRSERYKYAVFVEDGFLTEG